MIIKSIYNGDNGTLTIPDTINGVSLGGATVYANGQFNVTLPNYTGTLFTFYGFHPVPVWIQLKNTMSYSALPYEITGSASAGYTLSGANTSILYRFAEAIRSRYLLYHNTNPISIDNSATYTGGTNVSTVTGLANKIQTVIQNCRNNIPGFPTGTVDLVDAIPYIYYNNYSDTDAIYLTFKTNATGTDVARTVSIPVYSSYANANYTSNGLHWVIDWGDGNVQTCTSATVSSNKISHIYASSPVADTGPKYRNVKITYDTSYSSMYYGWASCIGSSTITNLFTNLANVIQVPYMSQGLSATNTGDNYMRAFATGCTSLVSFCNEVLPSGVTTVGTYYRAQMCYNCSALPAAAKEAFPSGVTTIGNYFRSEQYYNCSSLKYAFDELHPYGITATGHYFRANQYAYTAIPTAPAEALANTTTTINDYFRTNQYYYCFALITPANEVIPNSVTSIGSSFREYQYRNCASMETASPEAMSSALTSVGTKFRYAQYYDCTFIKSAVGEVFPNSVKTIGTNFRAYQYYDCVAIKMAATEVFSATIPAIPSDFRYCQYYNCVSLTTPAAEVLPSTVTSVGSDYRADMYHGCSAIKTPATEVYRSSTTTTGTYFRSGQYQNCTALTSKAAYVEYGTFGANKRADQYAGTPYA